MRRKRKSTGPVSWRERNKRPVRRLLLRVQRTVYYLTARIWRLFLFRTTFIAITGSVGKTTCKELLAAILSVHHATAKTFSNQNDDNGVPKTLLRVRPWHRYAVIEMATGRYGLIKRSMRLVRPEVGVFLSVARTHMDVFENLQNIAAEKADLLRGLPEAGVAFLNADEPLILRYRDECRARVVTFGTSKRADVRAENITGRWPKRLTFDAVIEGKRQQVSTRLVGTHWVLSVLAALAVGRELHIDIEDCLAAIAGVPPFLARLQPVRHPSGAILLRDEYNGSIDTLMPALEVLRESRVQRRVLVFSGLSYMPISSSKRFRKVARLAAECADMVVFIDKNSAGAGTRAALEAGMKSSQVMKFKDIWQAQSFLQQALQPGDLVLLRGRGPELSRLVYELFGPVGCRTGRCIKTMLCDVCSKLRPSRSPDPV